MAQDKLTIVREFDAPVEKVWQAWSDPEVFKKWWGPKDFSCPVSNIDFKVGGRYLSCMRGALTPGGEEKDFWSTGIYQEIIPMKKIVVSDSFADKEGNVVPSTYYGMEGFPPETIISVSFSELAGNRTKMTLEHSGVQDISENDFINMEQGWNQSFDKMEEVLKQNI